MFWACLKTGRGFVLGVFEKVNRCFSMDTWAIGEVRCEGARRHVPAPTDALVEISIPHLVGGRLSLKVA